jgi:hypothetical protein
MKDLFPSEESGAVVPPTIYVFRHDEWEYRCLERPPEDLPDEAELNVLGAEGWELAGIVHAGDVVTFYLKRRRE